MSVSVNLGQSCASHSKIAGRELLVEHVRELFAEGNPSVVDCSDPVMDRLRNDNKYKNPTVRDDGAKINEIS